VYGERIDRRWSLAKLTENYRPPNVGVMTLEGYGDIVSVNGMSLYAGYAFDKRWGGRNLRDTWKYSYTRAKRLGTAACADAQCLAEWRPFLAPVDAKSNGFWEPIKRDDGRRQWAYKGAALYTTAADRVRGDHSGQAVYDFKDPAGSGPQLTHAIFLEQLGRASGGAGIYWNLAKP